MLILLLVATWTVFHFEAIINKAICDHSCVSFFFMKKNKQKKLLIFLGYVTGNEIAESKGACCV